MKQRLELLLRPSVVGLITVLLVIMGASVVRYGELSYRDDKSRELMAQARILAATAAPALSFDDKAAAAEFVRALEDLPEIQLAALYDNGGKLFASASRGDRRAPETLSGMPSTVADGSRLKVATPVAIEGLHLGTALIEADITPPGRRVTRYAILTLLGAAVLLTVAVLTASRRVLGRANQALAARARDLAEANSALHAQIFEREQVEAALRQAQKMEAIGQLTGGLAHDFNNLLQIISLSLSGLALREPVRDDAPSKAQVQMGLEAVERGATLTRQLLAFSRRQPLMPRAFEVNPLVEKMCQLIERTLGGGIEVEWQPGDDVGAAVADSHQLESALLNLAVNARDAMPEGGRLTLATGRLAVAGDDGNTPAGDYVWISVSDTGTGMTPEVRERAMEPFFSTKEVGKGTGLGLSQVYGYARQSGGDLQIASEPGHGATLTLLLPCAVSDQAETDTEEPTQQLMQSPPERNVLVVEDDDTVLRTTVTALQTLGYRVRTATHAQEALALLERDDTIDILFSDVVMPGELNGFELALAARQRRPALRVLLTSGYPRTTLLSSVGHSPDIPLLAKPYNIDALAEQLQALT